MINLGIEFEIADNRANNFVVRAVPAIENLELALKDGEQCLDIAMFSGQALNDHCSLQ